MSNGHEVSNPNIHSTGSAEKPMNFSLGLARRPVASLCYLGVIRDTAFVVIYLANNNDLEVTDKQLGGGNGHVRM